jgi:hypothetical protein
MEKRELLHANPHIKNFYASTLGLRVIDRTGRRIGSQTGCNT